MTRLPARFSGNVAPDYHCAAAMLVVSWGEKARLTTSRCRRNNGGDY